MSQIKRVEFSEYSNLELPYKIPEYLKGLLNKNGNRFILVGNKRHGINDFYCAFKNKYFPKGGEKVRPYFETKVVKVKKEKENNNLCSPFCSWNGFCIHQKKRIGKKKCIVSENKGNWVNGENLDKIKFPCFCRWGTDPSMKNWVGMIQKNFWQGEIRYSLERIDRQTEESLTYGVFNNLKDLFKKNNIHILKGKIILFEEE